MKMCFSNGRKKHKAYILKSVHCLDVSGMFSPKCSSLDFVKKFWTWLAEDLGK